jgi:tRNA 2-thiouridine synthesizing protein E
MTTTLSTGKQLLVDENGYLIRSEDWDEEVAMALAAQEGLPSLSPDQMVIIRFMRGYFLKNGVFPVLKQVCRITHQKGDCVYQQFVNPEKAWKIAGLPKQDGVHFVSLDGEHYFMEPYC